MNFELEYSTVDVYGALRHILLPSDYASPAYEHFPPLRRLYQGRDWWVTEPLGRRNAGLSEPDTERCRTYYAIGKAHRPYLIAALGIGYGYALMSFAKGACAGGVPNATVNGYDDAGDGRVEWARQAFMTERIPYNLSHSNARQYDVSGIPLRHINLFHISDARSNKNLMQDLNLAVAALSPRAIIVVDSNDGGSTVTTSWADGAGYAVTGYSYVKVLTKL